MNIDLSLNKQLAHLSPASHLILTTYNQHKGNFIQPKFALYSRQYHDCLAIVSTAYRSKETDWEWNVAYDGMWRTSLVLQPSILLFGTLVWMSLRAGYICIFLC